MGHLTPFNWEASRSRKPRWNQTLEGGEHASTKKVDRPTDHRDTQADYDGTEDHRAQDHRAEDDRAEDDRAQGAGPTPPHHCGAPAVAARAEGPAG